MGNYDLGQEKPEGIKCTLYELEMEIVNVVPGDTNSDGRINIADVKKLADHTLKGNILNKYEIIAGEVTLDGKLNIADVKKLADYTIKGNMRLW